MLLLCSTCFIIHAETAGLGDNRETINYDRQTLVSLKDFGSKLDLALQSEIDPCAIRDPLDRDHDEDNPNQRGSRRGRPRSRPRSRKRGKRGGVRVRCQTRGHRTPLPTVMFGNVRSLRNK